MLEEEKTHFQLVTERTLHRLMLFKREKLIPLQPAEAVSPAWPACNILSNDYILLLWGEGHWV